MRLPPILIVLASLVSGLELWASQPPEPITVTVEEPWNVRDEPRQLGEMLAPAGEPGSIHDAMVKPAGTFKVLVSMPSKVKEGGNGEVIVRFSRAQKVPVKFAVKAFPKNVVTAPTTVVMDKGATSFRFKFTVKDDSSTSLNRLAGIELSIPGTSSKILNVSPIFDDEKPPRLSLSLPSAFTEGDTKQKQGIITLGSPLDEDGFVDLLQSPAGQLSIPSQVLIRAGRTSVKFPVSVIDDTVIEKNMAVTVSAKAGTRKLAQGKVEVMDNESKQLVLAFPASVYEGSVATATASMAGTIAKDVLVTISDGGSAELGIPGTVTIPAGSQSASFKIQCAQNRQRDGTRTIQIAANAQNFTGASRSVAIKDDDVDSYRVAGLESILAAGVPVKITVSAVDVEGNVIPGFSGKVSLAAASSGSVTMPLVPSSVTLSGGKWSGTVKLPITQNLITGLQVSDGSGITGGSAFSSTRVLDVVPLDLVWDETRQLIYASVENGSQILAIDPVTLQTTKRVSLGSMPGKLALTSGGEYLYASVKGNGTIAKIDPGEMTVLATFPVGREGDAVASYAASMNTLPGQPELLVVTRYPVSVGAVTNSIAIYENGLPKGTATPVRNGNSFIVPSTDPTLFFDLSNQVEEGAAQKIFFRSIKVDERGVSEIVFGRRLQLSRSPGERSLGNMIYYPDGMVCDGPQVKSAGRISKGGSVCADASTNRIFYIEPDPAGNDYYNKICVYDPVSHNFIGELGIPAVPEKPSNFIRWGLHGLAFSTSKGLTLVNSAGLVPGEEPADLVTTVTIPTTQIGKGKPAKFTVEVTNRGPGIARGATLATNFTGSATLSGVLATKGLLSVAGKNVNLKIGDLAVGMSTTLNVTTVSADAGTVTFIARAASHAMDPDFLNGLGSGVVNVGYRTGPDVKSKVALIACSQINDPGRGVIWLSIPGFDGYFTPPRRIAAPLARSIVSLDPRTGAVSKPISLPGDPVAGSIELSGNGRYLYVGLVGKGELCRIDLDTPSAPIERISLPVNSYGYFYDAGDIKALEGSGTSVLLTTSLGDSVVVIDGTVPRPVQIQRNVQTDADGVSKLRRTANPALFVGERMNNFCHLSLSSDGVRITKRRTQPQGLFPGTLGTGELWLWNSSLMYVNSLAQKVDLIPWSGYVTSTLDAANGKAYILNVTQIRAYDVERGSIVDALDIAEYDWEIGANSLIRWGSDGFAIVNYDGVIVTRWSVAAPVVASSDRMAGRLNSRADLAGDSDGDGIPNAFEVMFGTSSLDFEKNPVSISTEGEGGEMLIHLKFPRRVGTLLPSYGYEVSRDLKNWQPAASVTEKVGPLRTVDGISLEDIEATIPAPSPDGGFVRLKWME